MRYTFAFSCDQSTAEIINHLRETAQSIEHRTLARNVGPALGEWARSVGYGRNLALSRDWHVAYYKGFLPDGTRVYFLVWSAFEVVFVPVGYQLDMDKLHDLARAGEEL